MDNKKRNRKQYYAQDAKKPRLHRMDINLKGFLCSCNNTEKQCVRESYNVLNKYCEGPKLEQDVTENEDIEAALKKEVKDLKETKRFQVIDSGAKNLLFIRTTEEDPLKLATTIIADSPQTRFLIRLVPIQVTCKAYISDIKESLKPLLKHMEGRTSFSIAYNHRCNNNLKRDDVIKEIADYVAGVFAEIKVNLTNPEVTIIIEIIKSFAFLAVIPDYFKHKKFNLQIVGKDKNVEESVVLDSTTDPTSNNKSSDLTGL